MNTSKKLSTTSTTIRVSEKTKELIASKAIFGETYDTALQRLLVEKDGVKH